MLIPSSTYRIQFNKEFTFSHFANIIDYLEQLGITAIYASPILKAINGSNHGYDGVDPTTINEEIGTVEEFAKVSAILKTKGIGWIQDIVPNHMAFNTANIWLMDVLERGINSTYATYFDIDWNHPMYNGKLLVPFLEADLPVCVKEKKLSIAFNQKGFFIMYYDNAYPVNIESYTNLLSGCLDEEASEVNAYINTLVNADEKIFKHWNDEKNEMIGLLQKQNILKKIIAKLNEINDSDTELMTLIKQQHYILCNASDTNKSINYRRFFNVNALICLRMEDEIVFNDYHKHIYSLYKKGFIQGLRIDHIDGLKNPTEYIDRLRNLFGKECYIIAEKILDIKEEMPIMDIQGTSGYEFLSYVNQLITDKKGSESLINFYNNLVPEYSNYQELVFKKKLVFLEQYLHGEWDNLLRLLIQLNLVQDEEIKIDNLKKAIGVFMSALPVYRAYVDALPLMINDEQQIVAAFAKSIKNYPELIYEFDVLRLLFQSHSNVIVNNNRLAFIQRLMQFTGPLAAKGIEDTLFYIYNVLIAHNEVGDQPCLLGISVRTFHEKMSERNLKNPLSFNCTTTHDTKRGEDARIRINIISELPEEWIELVKHWNEVNDIFRVNINGSKAPAINDMYFLYQSILGGFPEDLKVTNSFIERTKQCLIKAVREAKVFSSHTNQNVAYEDACNLFVDSLLNTDSSFMQSFLPFVKKIIYYASTYSLSQVIIKATVPGIPDIYQGAELWDLSYVDPDNRRPVNYDTRKRILNDLMRNKKKGNQYLLKYANNNKELGTEKAFVTTTMLHLRKNHSQLFLKGEYIPIYAEGKKIIVSYMRKFQNEYVLVILPLGIIANSNASCFITLSVDATTNWVNIFSGEKMVGDKFDTNDLFNKFPVAVFKGSI